jgi:hypothetical protein
MEFNTDTTNRKKVVNAIAEYIGETSRYMGPPSFSYQVGCMLVDRNGKVATDNEELGEEVKKMLKEMGMAESIPEEDAQMEATTIKVPTDGFDVKGIVNLLNMLHSKQYLINKSIGVEGFRVNDKLITVLETLDAKTKEEAVAFITAFENYGIGFSFDEEGITFSGFPFTQNGMKIKAYCELAAMIVAYAKKQTRISPKETIEENEKYYMRVWLVRLGLGGKGGKEARTVLLKNLKVHTAFRTEEDKKKWTEIQKEKRTTHKSETGI